LNLCISSKSLTKKFHKTIFDDLSFSLFVLTADDDITTAVNDEFNRLVEFNRWCLSEFSPRFPESSGDRIPSSLLSSVETYSPLSVMLWKNFCQKKVFFSQYFFNQISIFFIRLLLGGILSFGLVHWIRPVPSELILLR